MVTPAMQLAGKIPDVHVQLWASSLLKGKRKSDAQAGLCLCCSQSRKVRVSRVYAHMMLKPRLPGLRLATRRTCLSDYKADNLSSQKISKSYICHINLCQTADF